MTPQREGEEVATREKVLNRMLSGARVKIEHAISGIKCCRIVKDFFG
jgi:hypothetical protein